MVQTKCSFRGFYIWESLVLYFLQNYSPVLGTNPRYSVNVFELLFIMLVESANFLSYVCTHLYFQHMFIKLYHLILYY